MNPISAGNPVLRYPLGTLRAWIDVFAELGKLRLSALVVLSTAVGYYLAGADFVLSRFLYTILGTSIAAAGANALNQCVEIERDRRMLRTRGRPLPSGRVTPAVAWGFGLTCALLGPLILTKMVNPPAAALCLATVVLYVLVYTPLKVLTPMNTFVGAIVGGLPPMIGWVAASGRLDGGAWLLGAILFVWQIPHFLALAWLYRDDYEKGGYRMLPVVDRAGRWTCLAVLGSCVALVPLTVALTLYGVTGWIYAAGAIISAIVFTAFALKLQRTRSLAHARGVFLASVLYLPVLLLLMVVDRAPPRPVDVVTPAVRLLAVYDGQP